MTMRKLKFFVNFDKEEAWLNRMATDGHLLTKVGMFYTFAPITSDGAVVRVDYRSSMKQSDFDDYLRLFEDSGWRHLGGSRHGGPQYFASFSDDANADIFSDAGTKAQRYRRSIAAYGILLLPFFVFALALWTQGTIGSVASTAPQDWYLTPGLWDMQGAEFVRAFLFETIFVFFRIGGPLLLVGFGLYLVALMAYQYVLYRRAISRSAVRAG